MKDFFVQLLSNSVRNDFPENQAQQFKNLLPYPLRFQETGWKVGLVSVSLLIASVPMNIKDDLLCRIPWALSEDFTRAMNAEDEMTISNRGVESDERDVAHATHTGQV